MKNNLRIWSIVLLGLLASATSSAAQILQVGDPAPDFSLQQLDGAADEPVVLSNFAGQVVFIVFFGYD